MSERVAASAGAAIPEDEKSEPKRSPQNGEHEWEWNNYDAFDYGKSGRDRDH